jgi:hypothetical protein
MPRIDSMSIESQNSSYGDSHLPGSNPSPRAQQGDMDCSFLAPGLTEEDCLHLSSIGMADQGINSLRDNSVIWIGTSGPNTFTFTNEATRPYLVPITLIIWRQGRNDFQSSFLNTRTPMVTYSLPNYGDSVTISVANHVGGAWSTIVNRQTALSAVGQVSNTWGEFTSGDWATINISRECNMSGNIMSATVAGSGCVAEMNTCVYQCKAGNSCGESGTYVLVNCARGSQPGAEYSVNDGDPNGGCQGWSNGGHIDVSLAYS